MMSSGGRLEEKAQIIVTLSYVECRNLLTVMLNVVMLNVVMLSVVAPLFRSIGV
jgi:hypothetical protein